MIRLNLRFLAQQTAAFLLIGYVALAGSTTLGLILYDLRVLNVIVLGLVVAAWLVSWTLRGSPFPRTRLDLAWLLFIAAQAAATGASIDPRRSLTPLTLTILYWLAFYLAVDLLRRDQAGDMLVSALLFAGAMFTAFGAIQLINWYHSWWVIGGWAHPLPPATLRLQLIASHPNLLAAYLNVLLPFGLMAWFKVKGRIAKIALALWIALILALLFFTSSRGGWIGTAIAAIVSALLLALDRRAWVAARRQHLRRHPAYLATIGLSGVGLLAAATFLLIRQAQHPTHGALFSSRQDIWSPVWMTLARFPLWGSGPATYATQAMQAHSIPPYPLYIHAHSLLFNTLLESGLIGTLALIGLGIAAARSARMQWRSADESARPWLIAAIAALAATLVHSLFETPQILPGFSLLIVLILALIESISTPAGRPAWIERVSRIALGLAWPVLIGALAAGLAGYATYARGVGLANATEYPSAAPLLDQAAVRDPALATNWFQAGYAHAATGLENGDSSHLQQAAEDYQKGLDLEPDFAVNWINLGALLWRMGDERGAQRALEQAVERAPQEATFVLTLGAFEEEKGDPTRAAELYRRGLEAYPTWAYSAFFRATQLRTTVRERWQAARPAPVEPLQTCWDAVHAGQFDRARPCFSAARTLNDPQPYYGLGLTESAAGNLAQAEWYLRVAAWISDQDPDKAARLNMALGDVLARRGDLPGAINEYERALTMVIRPGPMGNSASGVTTSYTWLVFDREAIIDRFLPGVAWITVTDDIAERMLQLGDWYEQVGRKQDALRLYRDLVKAAPDLKPAEERLRNLEAATADSRP